MLPAIIQSCGLATIAIGRSYDRASHRRDGRLADSMSTGSHVPQAEGAIETANAASNNAVTIAASISIGVSRLTEWFPDRVARGRLQFHANG